MPERTVNQDFVGLKTVNCAFYGAILRESMTDKSQSAEVDAEPKREIDPRLLEILICPKTRGPLSYDRAKQELVSKRAKLAYPIRRGVPIMLPDEARKLG